LLRAHEYWRMKGLAVDLVILNEEKASYVEYLQSLLEGMVRESQALSAPYVHENRGAIFVLRVEWLSAEERLLLRTAARAVLVSNRGTLAEQLLRHPHHRQISLRLRQIQAPWLMPLHWRFPRWNFSTGWAVLPKTGANM
ncbi:MAG: hypothetical protein ACOYMG_09335, partial [Candidatus Methylumidiphilus sp.]